MKPLLKIENLSASVGGKKVLNGLSLEVNAGEVHAIMGPNGSGKSTLSYVLAGRPGTRSRGAPFHLKAAISPRSSPRKGRAPVCSSASSTRWKSPA